jgi:LacI family transcriptional regulator
MLSDVAALAGVSATTASYILNGRAAEMRISAATEQRVRTAAAQLHYRPNRVARNLRTSRTKALGVISDFVASGHFANGMISGAGAASRASGHLLVIGETEGDVDVEAALIHEMLDRRVDGIIYATLVTMEIAVPPILREVPTVLMNCVDSKGGLASVIPDEVNGGREAAALLVEAGRASATYVVGEDRTPNAVAGPWRVAGVEATLMEAGEALLGVVSCDWSVQGSYVAVDSWLREGARPGALVCMNDRVAMGVYQALAHHELDVPGDVAVVSFDASELASWLRPPVTSVGLPYVQIGARAVERLLAGDGAGSLVELVPMPVVHGGSVSSGASPPSRTRASVAPRSDGY